MNRAKVNGVELEYEVHGAGEPVLLIDMLIADCFVPLLTEPALARYRARFSRKAAPRRHAGVPVWPALSRGG